MPFDSQGAKPMQHDPDPSMSNVSSLAIWHLLRQQAEVMAVESPALAAMLQRRILGSASLEDALVQVLADALSAHVPADIDLIGTLGRTLAAHADIADAAQADLLKLARINPACPSELVGLLSFRGFQALQLHRINHALWHDGQEALAVLLQNWGALAFAVDIHPQARIGRAVFLDHAIGIVIGATAVVEDEVNIWHGVTLGSTLTQAGDRHPKIRRGATLGAGATVLGNIEVGEGAVVAAGSVVLSAVDPSTVVAGVPAKPVGNAKRSLDAIAGKP